MQKNQNNFSSIKFDFDPRIKDGYYTAAYFEKASKILQKFKPADSCIMQFTFFGDKPIMVCGINEAIQLLKFCLTKKEIDLIQVFGRNDGDIVEPKTPVLLIKGPYYVFAKYENVIDSILARRSSVANNCYQTLKLVNTDNVLYMADRTDDYLIQKYDGYAAYIGGIRHFVTNASVELIKHFPDITVGGTIPHALIQQFNGDLNQTLHCYADLFGNDKMIGLVDYHNDIEHEIKSIAKDFPNLYAIRIDTSSNMIDAGLIRQYPSCINDPHFKGINPNLVKFARKVLDENNMKNTKIVVSSGVNIPKIQELIESNAPVDLWGIGTSLITRNIHFTADLVYRNDTPEAKTGRKLFININNINSLTRHI